MPIFQVYLSKRAQKQLERVPSFIAEKLLGWVQSVSEIGLQEVRKIPGYHDEPLHGDRTGQRSIRLNRSYRAIYEVKEENQVEFVLIEEVIHHDY